ncbi:MAG: cysteine desulfurase NifS [bacterium]|nr:cysteine desulfurase NifS [bacterium]
MKRIYLDYAATTPTDPEVVEAMLPYFSEQFGNPSSIHSFGQESKAAIEDAREQIASFLGAKPEEIIFTSGGTESSNLALKGVAYANEQRGKHIISTEIEHHAVLESCRFLEQHGFSLSYLPVDRDGLLDPDDVKKALTDDTILISVMHANNELGTIEAIAEIGDIARERGICFHSDAVQTFGHIPVNVDELHVDLLSLSAHKLYGPKGVGALYVRKDTRLLPLLHGGEQERRRRASTENVPAIVGFGKAVELVRKTLGKEAERLSGLRDRTIEALLEKIEDCCLNGHPTQRLPNNINVSIKYVDGESMLLNLDMEAIAASAGSACSSGSLEPSHALLALGRSRDLALGGLRLSLGKHSTEEELDHVVEVLSKIVTKLRASSPLRPTNADLSN